MSEAKILLASQVGGHAGISTTEDGSLLIKPALANEVRFYESLTTHFGPLLPFVPKFFGTLRLHGSVEGTTDVQNEALKTLRDGVKEDKDELSLSVFIDRPFIVKHIRSC